MSDTFRVTCPHCGSVLEIDGADRIVVGHERPTARRERELDFEARLKALEAEKRRAAERMQEAMRAEQAKDRVLEERFRRLLDAAGDDDGPPPVRDIDLD